MNQPKAAAKKVVSLILLLAVLVININCSNQGDKLVVGVHSWPGGGPIYVGDVKGFFAEQGIDLQVLKIESFDTKRASLIAGEIDIDVASTMDQLLIYNNAGFDAQVFLVSDQSTGGDGIVAKSNIQSIQDLKGKTIAYAEASPSDFFMRFILKQQGISIDSVSLSPVADPQIAGNAIIAKQVDAAVTYEPWLSQASETDGLQLLVTTEEYPNLIPGLMIASKQRLNEKEDLFRRFVTAWYKSVDYYYQNPEEAKQIMSEGMELEVSEVESILDTIRILDKPGNDEMFNASITDNLFDLVGDISTFWLENEYIESSFSGTDLVNDSFK